MRWLLLILPFSLCACGLRVYIPVPVPPTKVALTQEPKCETTNAQSTPDMVIKTALQCIERKSSYIGEIKIRLKEYIQ